MKPSSYVANFDSATAMLRALSNYLKGEDFPLLGAMPRRNLPLMKLVATTVNHLPSSGREQVYIWSGRFEAINPKTLHVVKTDEIADWITSLYPRYQYPAVAIGSSNGAAVHLWSGLGIPWLPQTFLIPVARSGIHPDDPRADAEWAREPAHHFLKANPDVQLHHMNDPVQDRLMIQRMAYFRVKRLRLGPAYKRFLLEHLSPGATIYLMDCQLRWPATKYNERYFFQFGALGGATAQEYHHGSDRVKTYLEQQGSPVRQWTPPHPNSESPEAEWGFEPTLGADVADFAGRYGFKVRRLTFDQPEHFSPFVADFYRWWNRKRSVRDQRLLIESFIVMDPYWTVRTGSVPFWMVFNKEPSAQALESYLHDHSFKEIYLMLFSHGVNSIGLVPIKRWRKIIELAQEHGSFIGVDPKRYPRDFGVFVRYNPELKRRVSPRYPLPPALTVPDFEQFLTESIGRYRISWQ